ncbi:hypothetical protein ABZ078_29855 [Streptomyces sp. NPDC006385]|uniref:hypothetical protein n=1 Tax=Streptomyces sp. NPDC006385 TaxID=3156761 RepID=UPI00339E4797
MTTASAPEVLSSFGTGLQHTRVLALPDGGIGWEHTPGPDNPDPRRSVQPGFVGRAREASDTYTSFAVPCDGADGRWLWRTTGRRSAAQLLLSADDLDGRLEPVFRRLGERLKALHAVSSHDDRPGDYPRPAGAARLMAWLDGGGGPRAATGWRQLLRMRLGARRWEELRELTHGVLHPAPGAPVTVVHGWLGLGMIVIADSVESTPGAVVLSGPHATWSSPETDLACTVGELLELTLTAERLGDPQPMFGRLRDALLAGYGPGWDQESVATGAVVRIVTHAHDFGAYVGWSPDIHHYVPMIADLIDSRGAAALPPR